ncbi:MAG: hypothetical protein WBM90_12405 [Acidimicrobiia bacterium]
MNEPSEPDPRLASELRESAGREWTEEAAEDERLTELGRRRNFSLSDLAKEMVNRGDRVSVEFGGHSFSGAVVSAGEDYVTVTGSGQIGEIRMATARWSILPSGLAVEKGVGAAESFIAALHQHAAAATNIRLTLSHADMVIGSIAVVAADHLEVADVDGRRLFVPLEMVLGTIRSLEPH